MKKMLIGLVMFVGLACLASAQSMQQRSWLKEHMRQLEGVDMTTVVSGAALGATALQPAGRLTGSLGSATTAVDTVVSGAALGATALQPTNFTVVRSWSGTTGSVATAFGSCTNGQVVAFPVAFTFAPVVVLSPESATTNIWYVSSLTASNFVANTETGVSGGWMAIGLK